MDLLPVNVPEATVVSRASDVPGLTAVKPNPPDVDDLASWSQENYQMDTSAAAHLGFPVASIGVDAKRSILIFGSSRWADTDSGDGHVYRFGVALRVLVEVSGLDIKGGLTLPQVAANVEVHEAQASAQLVVRGYNGDLGTMLPPWQAFNVTSYAEYVQCIDNIQKQIMGDSGHIRPQLLATTIAGPTLPPLPDAHVGTVHALRAIAAGQSLQQALDSANGADLPADAQAAVRQEYQQQGLAADGAAPDEVAREKAKADLDTIAPVHHRFLESLRGNKIVAIAGV